MENTSEAVSDGRLVHEYSYPQRNQNYEEVEFDGIKVDFYDTRRRIIHEIKRSDKIEDAHIWQLKYYIYVFENNGISGCSGILEYPKLRKTHPVSLSKEDKDVIANNLREIERIATSSICPQIEKHKMCRNCSYYDLCFVTEQELI